MGGEEDWRGMWEGEEDWRSMWEGRRTGGACGRGGGLEGHVGGEED